MQDLFLSRLQAGSTAGDIAGMLLAFYCLCSVLALQESVPLAFYVFGSLFPFLVFGRASILGSLFRSLVADYAMLCFSLPMAGLGC